VLTFGTLFISTYRIKKESGNLPQTANLDLLPVQSPSSLWRWAQILFQAGFCNTLGVTICFWSLLADGILPTFNETPLVKVIVSIDHIAPLLFYLVDSLCSMTTFEWRYFSLPLLIAIIYTIFNIIQSKRTSATYSVLDWSAHPREAAVTQVLIFVILILCFLFLWFFTKLKNSCYRRRYRQ
jgi:hypothetical protein